MRLLRWFDRLLSHPAALKVLAPLTVIALAGAAFAVFGVLANDAQRESDRISADLASCTRGNVFRSDQKAIVDGVVTALEGILQSTYRHIPRTLADQLAAEQEPVLLELRVIGDSIELVNCQALIPGASTTTEAP